MSSTPNILIPLIAQSQNNKEVTFNTAIDLLDEAFCSNKSEALTPTTFAVPQNDFLMNGFIKFTGALSATCTISLPPTGGGKWFIILNATTGGQNLVFEVGTNTITVTISDTNPHVLYSDGVGNVYKCS